MSDHMTRWQIRPTSLSAAGRPCNSSHTSDTRRPRLHQLHRACAISRAFSRSATIHAIGTQRFTFSSVRTTTQLREYRDRLKRARPGSMPPARTHGRVLAQVDPQHVLQPQPAQWPPPAPSRPRRQVSASNSTDTETIGNALIEPQPPGRLCMASGSMLGVFRFLDTGAATLALQRSSMRNRDGFARRSRFRSPERRGIFQVGSA